MEQARAAIMTTLFQCFLIVVNLLNVEITTSPTAQAFYDLNNRDAHCLACHARITSFRCLGFSAGEVSLGAPPRTLHGMMQRFTRGAPKRPRGLTTS
jgi:hypothetical protein